VGFDVISPFPGIHQLFKWNYISALFFISLPSTLRHVPDFCWPVVARVPQISSDILSGRNCAVLIQIYFTTLNTALNKKTNYILLSRNKRGKTKKKEKFFFFNCLPIMHFDLACKMWRVLLRWRRKQSEGDKTTQRCLARCLWTVFFFVILKGTVQWIVQIEECLSYICQCSFYII